MDDNGKAFCLDKNLSKDGFSISEQLVKRMDHASLLVALSIKKASLVGIL